MKSDFMKNLPMFIFGLVLLIFLLAIYFFMPPASWWITTVFLILILGYFFLARIIQKQQAREKKPRFWHNFVSLISILAIMLVVFVVLLINVAPSIMVIVITVALAFTLLVNFLTVPLAIIHKIRERKEMRIPITSFPKVSIIVPAYNEELLLARTMETLIEAEYPNKEIIIVDDGSTDSTFQIARRFQSKTIKAIHRPNGGKFAALNTGLVFATGEIVITVDADSLISRAAIIEIVKGFQNPDVIGVAGNLKVLNRKKFLAKLQALEYTIQIHVVRRAFENFGAITVASGAFSAFRRTAIDECGRYDPDRLLEDFDLTIKLMKSNRIMQGNIEAICYTEAPETWKDVYKQRLSWYRGDFQNFWKHRDAFFNPRFGVMHRMTLPYMLIAMTFVPIASILIIITSILMAMHGQWMTLIYAFSLFVVLEYLLSILGIIIAEEDMKLAIWAPFFIIGYKQFLDFTMLRAFFDVLLGGGQYLKRERVERIGEPKPSTKVAVT
jgi:cellulose synthase/poly-beta-1,6-N-acetylglucosamine synthase-like glycosyltransferase